jgi:RNA polymerase sigma-70 factor (ECF subfamily)
LETRAGEQDIEDWARRAQRGDHRALAQLLRAVRPRVFRWALVQTGSPDDAEDITQTALLRVQRGLRHFAFAARFTTWLYSVTRSAAADARRIQRRRAELLAERTPADVASSSEPRVDERRLLALVRDQLDALPARQREVFDLVDLQGRAPGDVAELLALDAATVRVHLLRARRTIRAHIAERNPALVEDRC